ncbi:MAG: hypothetical protein U9Q17_02640 [Chloroflexota bacterium]|nr:hypothetical protein [Chloroflexota bacterium]
MKQTAEVVPEIRRFLLREADKVSSEWKVTCDGHNLFKLFKAREELLGREFLVTAFE